MDYETEITILRDQQKSDWQATIVGMQSLAQQNRAIAEQTRLIAEQTRVTAEQTSLMAERMQRMEVRTQQMFDVILDSYRDLNGRLTAVEKRLAS